MSGNSRQRRKILRDHLDALNISIRQAGPLCGVSFSVIAKFMRGEHELSEESWRRVQAWIDGNPITGPRELRTLETRVRELERRMHLMEVKFKVRAE